MKSSDLFVGNILYSLGDGTRLSFWYCKWLVNHPCVIEAKVVVALKEIWSSKIPSKIQIFWWEFFLDRLATKDRLLKRGIISRGNVHFCVLCNGSEESFHHLYLVCVLAVNVWKRVER
ncbi:hypothetical protein KIW84_012283 [Lathyrus oleraceus]|uniref:Reverse transcriptase zinc-binding domain-containing protein n=1 Tax=Pisum sativum TaxID=3888 RepID=A0A9D5BH48_PEA|nr:hypothetical protein KIW84_012283 [Pisum sativum]